MSPSTPPLSTLHQLPSPSKWLNKPNFACSKFIHWGNFNTQPLHLNSNLIWFYVWPNWHVLCCFQIQSPPVKSVLSSSPKRSCFNIQRTASCWYGRSLGFRLGCWTSMSRVNFCEFCRDFIPLYSSWKSCLLLVQSVSANTHTQAHAQQI